MCTFLPIAALTGSLYADQGEAIAEETTRPNPAGLEVLNAFRAGYPLKTGEIALTPNGWTIAIGGSFFHWDGGRLLSEDYLSASERFTAHPFCRYPEHLPELKPPTSEQKRSIEARITHREENPPTRNPGIYNAIWRISDENSAWNQAKTTFFLGKRLLIHRDLLDELAAIEEELLFYAGGDLALGVYIQSLGQVEGYSWRPIAGTASLSYHSYGTAIDFLPKSYAGKQTYWRWARDRYPQWYVLPYEMRLMPPESFVTAFEKRGFIWGGKWFYFDTMHFEYRPEILILNGYVQTILENPATGVRESVWSPPGEG